MGEALPSSEKNRPPLLDPGREYTRCSRRDEEPPHSRPSSGKLPLHSDAKNGAQQPQIVSPLMSVCGKESGQGRAFPSRRRTHAAGAGVWRLESQGFGSGLGLGGFWWLLMPRPGRRFLLCDPPLPWRRRVAPPPDPFDKWALFMKHRVYSRLRSGRGERTSCRLLMESIPASVRCRQESFPVPFAFRGRRHAHGPSRGALALAGGHVGGCVWCSLLACLRPPDPLFRPGWDWPGF